MKVEGKGQIQAVPSLKCFLFHWVMSELREQQQKYLLYCVNPAGLKKKKKHFAFQLMLLLFFFFFKVNLASAVSS